MNPASKNIVKEKLQNLLNVGFMYPISDSKWVSPLVVVPKKTPGKWRICVDFRELNKSTLKDYFPLPFINQVLETLLGNTGKGTPRVKFWKILKISIVVFYKKLFLQLLATEISYETCLW